MTLPPDNPYPSTPVTLAETMRKLVESDTQNPSPARDLRYVSVGELFDAMMGKAVETFRDGDSADAADLKESARLFLSVAKRIARECPDLDLDLSYGGRLSAGAGRLDVKA